MKLKVEKYRKSANFQPSTFQSNLANVLIQKNSAEKVPDEFDKSTKSQWNRTYFSKTPLFNQQQDGKRFGRCKDAFEEFKIVPEPSDFSLKKGEKINKRAPYKFMPAKRKKEGSHSNDFTEDQDTISMSGLRKSVPIFHTTSKSRLVQPPGL